MKKRLLVAAAAAIIVASLVVPLASSHGQDQRVAIGVRLDFTSGTHAEGSFAVCCAITDSGDASADVTSFEPEGNKARFVATNTFVGSNGSFTLELRGVTGPLESPVHVARGRWTVTDGTGAYAQLEGQGRFKAVTDQETGALTAIDTGEIQGAEG